MAATHLLIGEGCERIATRNRNVVIAAGIGSLSDSSNLRLPAIFCGINSRRFGREGSF